MTEEIIIDVSNCSHKSDDDCMEMPICNEYGDLMGYQSCEAQTLCPYRSQKKITRLEQENKALKKQIESDKGLITVGGKQQYKYLQRVDKLEQENKELKTKLDVFAFTISQYESALEEIKNSVINYLPKENYKFAKSFNPEQFELFENILTKINEVLNDK